jgi:glycosidase
MEPPEFWNWAIARARERRSDAVFVAEAYDNDPAKVPGSDPVISNLNGGNSNVMSALLNAGFNAVYDDPTYRILKKIYEGPAWANDLDGAFPDGFIFDNSLRYAENHDEVRLAAPSQWGGIGMSVGRPVAAILYGLSRGAIMVYNGQEVGEPGAAREGFGSDDSRTSIFDYWSMPQFVKWNNGWKYDGAKLSPEQAELRAFYGRLVTLAAQPAFRDGEFVPLNAANNKNLSFGATEGETAGGHWMYAFLRVDQASQTRFLVVVNLHKSRSFKDVKINIPAEALRPWRDAAGADQLKFTERLGGKLEITVPWAEMNKESAVPIPEVPPLTAFYFEISG